jgi:hypothetical protein
MEIVFRKKDGEFCWTARAQDAETGRDIKMKKKKDSF